VRFNARRAALRQPEDRDPVDGVVISP